MKRTTNALILLIFLFGGFSAFAQQPDYSPTQVVLRFDQSVNPIQQQQILASYNLEIVDGPTPVTRFLLCEISASGFPNLPPGSYSNAPDSINGVIETMEDLEADIDGIGLQYDLFPPNFLEDKLEGSGGPYTLLDSCEAGSFSLNIEPLGITMVDVGVYDTGISGTATPTGFDLDHPTLFEPYFEPNEPGVNFIDYGSYPEDDNGHGTLMTSIMVQKVPSASLNADFPMAFRAYKTHDSTGVGKIFNIIQAIDQGILEQVKIANFSFSYAGPPEHRENANTPLYAAMREALVKSGTLFIVAAGNNHIDNDNDFGFVAYPASFNLPNIISVASVGCNGQLSSFSNMGARSVDLGAPGEDIIGAYLGTQFARISGTSPAAAMVSRVAAMLASFQDNFDFKPIKCAILNGATPHQSLIGRTVSGGYLDAEDAYEYFINNPGCTTPSYTDLTRDTDEKILTLGNANQPFSIQTLNTPYGITLLIAAPKNQIAQISIFNALGQVIRQESLPLQAGNNEYYWANAQDERAELYLLEVRSNSQREVIKVIR